MQEQDQGSLARESGNALPEDTPAPAENGAGAAAEQLRKAEDEARDMREAWLRARADTENVRRQAQNELAKAHKYAVERMALDLLPVKDALESALAVPNATPEALRAGVELTLRQLESAFEKAQITPIDPAGEKFDPHQHAAMTMLDSDQPANTVAQVMQKGYRLADRVLRPALVAVAKPKGDA
jgi:molecular chaperone GrpE